jgi:hypothetical protein
MIFLLISGGGLKQPVSEPPKPATAAPVNPNLRKSRLVIRFIMDS